MSKEYIAEAISKIRPTKDTILVTGTGLSLALTENSYPQLSWLGLIKHGYDYATESGLLEEESKEKWLGMLSGDSGTDEILSVAGFLSKKLSGPGHVNYARWFNKAFSQVTIADDNLRNILKNISDAGVRFCTLNYDSLLEQATGLPSITIDDTDSVISWLKGDKKAILHLHGYWEKTESCVLSDSDYERILGNKPRDFFQQNLTVLQTLIFVGCGGTFNDPNFQNILKWLNSDLKSGRIPNFALTSSAESASRKKEWYGLVETVEYGAERAQLPGFLENLFSSITNKTSPGIGEIESTPPMRLMEQGIKRVNLDAIRISLMPSPQSTVVRHAQLHQAKKGLEEQRSLWIAADWGMHEDEFVWALVSQESADIEGVYEINVENYTTRELFGRQVQEIFGQSFESFCNELSVSGASYLIFRDVPFDSTESKDALYLEFETLSQILTSFCHDLRVIMISRQPPPVSVKTVELLALSAADTMAYIENHSLYRGGLNREDFHQLFEYSNGVPGLIIRALEKLTVASMHEIVTERGATNVDISGRLSVLLSNLANSKDIKRQYAFSLLKSLSAFPYGEYLENIKRVNKVKKFTTDHVLILLKEGFIYIEEQDRFGHAGVRTPKKRLVVTRGARQWIQQEVKARELKKIKSDAIKLYFGDSWETNNIKFHSIFKSGSIGEQSSEINNARSFIVDVFSTAVGSERSVSVAMSLASQFCAMITRKSYYKAVQDLYISLKPWFELSIQDSEYWYLSYLYAKALRMSDVEGASSEALELLLNAEQRLKDSKTSASIHLIIALIYSKRKQHDKAIEHAEKVQKLARGGDSLQAAHVILLAKQEPGLDKELSQLEVRAKKAKGAPYVNIALDRIIALPDDSFKIKELEQVVDFCKSNSLHYSRVRSFLDLASTLLKVNKRLEPQVISELIGIYHHLHNDNLAKLHDKCHNLLWTVFSQNNDILNLLQLFKYSSLFWRLRDNSKAELNALSHLQKLERSSSLAGSERDPARSYYHGRSSSLLR